MAPEFLADPPRVRGGLWPVARRELRAGPVPGWVLGRCAAPLSHDRVIIVRQQNDGHICSVFAAYW